MTAGVTAFLYLMAIFDDVSTPPCSLHTNACTLYIAQYCTLLTQIMETLFFLLRLPHFFCNILQNNSLFSFDLFQKDKI